MYWARSEICCLERMLRQVGMYGAAVPVPPLTTWPGTPSAMMDSIWAWLIVLPTAVSIGTDGSGPPLPCMPWHAAQAKLTKFCPPWAIVGLTVADRFAVLLELLLVLLPMIQPTAIATIARITSAGDRSDPGAWAAPGTSARRPPGARGPWIRLSRARSARWQACRASNRVGFSPVMRWPGGWRQTTDWGAQIPA